jgi:glycosyltransferase involved in cell wall biosynthesis
MSETEAARTYRGRELIRKKQQMIDASSVFIAVSEYIREALIAKDYPEDKIVVHRNGIDLEFFSVEKRMEREKKILFVGRFVEKKGTIYLLQAAKVLKDAGVDFELVMIGDGPLATELKAIASNAGIRCSFPGFLPVEEVRNWLARSRVVAVPSVVAANGDSEGLPTVLLEAQAMETPVVATRHSGIPEGVIDGVTAELVDEKDVDALADRLKSFLLSPEKARQFGESGRRYVTQYFDMEQQVSGLEDIYERVHTEYRSPQTS